MPKEWRKQIEINLGWQPISIHQGGEGGEQVPEVVRSKRIGSGERGWMPPYFVGECPDVMLYNHNATSVFAPRGSA